MIWIILFLLSIPVFAYSMWRLAEKDDRDWGTFFLSGGGYAVFGGMIFMIVLLLSSLAVKATGVETNDTIVRQDLTALSDGFFLAAKKSYYYTYYAGSAKTGYKQYTARIENSVIFEDATPGTAYVEIIEDKNETRFWYLYMANDNKYEFHIPAGSILRKYELGD